MARAELDKIQADLRIAIQTHQVSVLVFFTTTCQ